MRKTIVENIDLIAFHPDQYIGELIEDYNMTQKEFAEKVGGIAKDDQKISER